jgi:hypothetical protein
MDFLRSNTGCSENSPLHIRETRPHQRKTLTMVQLLHPVQNEETNYKNVFLQPDLVSSKHEAEADKRDDSWRKSVITDCYRYTSVAYGAQNATSMAGISALSRNMSTLYMFISLYPYCHYVTVFIFFVLSTPRSCLKFWFWDLSLLVCFLTEFLFVS